MKKKICKLSTIVCLLLFFLSLTTAVNASTESQARVAEGRALLFNSGNPTYSGLLAANAKFKEALDTTTGDPDDLEANLFYAVTRILSSGFENGTELETLRDIFEAFGISRNDVDSVDAGTPFNDPPEIYGHYDPPATIPMGEDVRAFLAGPFVTLINNSIANLDKIKDDFTTILTTVEINDDDKIEVDCGDVLMLKSALYTLKSAILIMTAYDLNIDLHELAVLGNADVLQIQRDILNKYQDVLKLRGVNGADGTASLTNAKSALFDGINAYEAAFIFITNESPLSQGNELFYFESGEDQREANSILTQLTELKNSLNNNQVAQFTTIDEMWILTDVNGKRLQIEIEKDVNDNFLSGYDAWGLDGCDFLFCGGWVEDYTLSGTTITFDIACSGWCPGSATLTGTLSENQIINGTYSATNCERNWSGTFAGVLESSKTETETIDFNCIFGNAATANPKFPLDIREILPKFDQNNEIIAGTFPPTNGSSPVLNGVLLELTTNQALTDEMDLQPASVNTSFVSGAITCSNHTSDNNIFVWACDGPDQHSARRLENAVADVSGNYTIEGLPAGASVYIFARWDVDNNGIKTFEDYLGMTGPITVASGGATGADFSLNISVDDSFHHDKTGCIPRLWKQRL